MIGVSAKERLSLLNTPQHHCSKMLSLADVIGEYALIANKGNIADTIGNSAAAEQREQGNIGDKGHSAAAEREQPMDTLDLVVCILLFNRVPESKSRGRRNSCC